MLKKDETDNSLADIHKTALAEFTLCRDADQHNREAALDDLKFARLSQQWHQEDLDKRQAERRPCLTINKMPSFIRQVVNDGRQNKPAIKVHPADDKADPPTAEIINDLIRNIEYSSNADVAYDTGLEYAASCSFGYWRVGIEYAHDDTFEKDLRIQRIANPLTVYRDYESTEADSSDWKRCFVVETISKKAFEKKYKGKAATSWDDDAFKSMPMEWRDNDDIVLAEYWVRREIPRTICLMSDGSVVGQDWLEADADLAPMENLGGLTNGDVLEAQGITLVDERETSSYKVTQYIMNGVEILETNDWAGCYIPIVPVYGEELNVEGKRYFRSLIRDAKDAQRNFNYWRSASTELVALAPKAPWVGPVGSFVTDGDKWATANTESHQHLEYDPVVDATTGAPLPPPQRQPFAGVPAGALQEALNASDDMKAVMGIYDAGLGARSNETSGIAISARKSESDTGTFHFIDNQARAIRHTGRILLDLIPKVYNKSRIIRVIGEDKQPRNVQINQQLEGVDQIYNLTVGKYDLTVDTGPAFQTKRQEAAAGMAELLRVYPASAPVVAPLLAKTQDWPDAPEVALKLEALDPTAGGKSPQAQAAQQQVQQLSQALQEAQKQLKDKSADQHLDLMKAQIDAYNAETNRLKVTAPAMAPQEVQALVVQTVQQVLSSPDVLPAVSQPVAQPQATPAPAQAEPALQPQ